MPKRKTPPRSSGSPPIRSKKKSNPVPTDEFQQVTLPAFVDRFGVDGMGFGGDVYYQPNVEQPSCDEYDFAIANVRLWK